MLASGGTRDAAEGCRRHRQPRPEWPPSGIRVNAVAPTWVRTNLTAPLLDQPGILERIAALTPLKRLATPDEIAWAILYLASPAAAMVTGHTLAVDGGFLAQ